MTCNQGDDTTRGKLMQTCNIIPRKNNEFIPFFPRNWKVQENWQKHRSFSHAEDSLRTTQSSQRSARDAAAQQ